MKTTPRKKPAKKRASAKTQFVVTLELNGTEFVSKGTTALAAVEALEFDQPKTKGVLTARFGKLRSNPQLIVVPTLKRLAVSKFVQIIWAKRLEMTMK